MSGSLGRRASLMLLAVALLGGQASAASDGVSDLESAGFAVRRSPDGRLARFAAAAGSSVTSAVARGGDAGGRAMAFLDRFGAAFGVDGRAGTRVLRASGPDAVGMDHVRVQQMVDGVPVA